MKISTSTDFAASPAQVYAVISDQAYQDVKAANGTLPGSTSTVTPNGDGARVETRRVLATDGFPSFVRSVVGEQLVVDEVQTWGPAAADGSRTADLEVQISGAPVSLTGTISLTGTDGGTTQSVDGDLKAKIPFLGSKVEEAAAPAIKAVIEAEFDLIRARL